MTIFIITTFISLIFNLSFIMRFILFGIQIMLREEEDLVVFGWDVFIQAIGVVMVNLHWLWESSLLDLLQS